ncbi:hypothetical protein V2J09_011643 [Rumex salicifolius]
MSLCSPSISSSFFVSTDLSQFNEFAFAQRIGFNFKFRLNRSTISRVFAMSKSDSYKTNLNEYMVTLEKPLGIRFALSVDGKIFVHSLRRGGNAERSRIIMVGDTLKKASNSSGSQFIDIKGIGDTEHILEENNGSFSLVLERPFSPFPIQKLHMANDHDIMFNRGRVALATWSKSALGSGLKASPDCNGNAGFAVFSPKYLSPEAWKMMDGVDEIRPLLMHRNAVHSPLSQLVCTFSEKDSGDAEWAHGNFPLEEYAKALERSKGEMYYNHSLGMHYSKITEQIYVGSCIQSEDDIDALKDDAVSGIGITAILNFQSTVEAENWGINSSSINEDGDSFDMRKKLPFIVGLLLRLLKKNHRVFLTCTTGLDRSSACVVAYLHWMTDTSLNAAYNFVTGLHVCRPDRAAIAWATWDLIAMVEKGSRDGPSTHAVTFVWNGHEGEDVCLVGDFTGNWKEPIKATHAGGSRFEAEVRLTQGKYYYKYIVNGQWKHSNTSPTERDERGNTNNIIIIGDTANVRPSLQHPKKDANIIKVIERPLTENERFVLAKAARCIAFSVCPMKLSPKINKKGFGSTELICGDGR